MDKNEELAKLLGIEPKIAGVTYSCCNHACGGDECQFFDEEVYPDFTKPSNFIKLLESRISNIYASCTLLHVFTNDDYENIENVGGRESFLEWLLEYLQKNESDLIKDSLQRIEWEY